IEYKIEGYGMFQEMMRGVREEVVKMMFRVQISRSEEVRPKAKVTGLSRNDPCPCGSGKKYKKCCMLKEQ
ncbi:MAG: SEC-C metal-binding domain-containing protein, partial [Candidatus Margulisbacteria bacterium]|nr:SEC-C metal-binding domain-containing protein [Candidatus Margulisiibacteriota bacterium]